MLEMLVNERDMGQGNKGPLHAGEGVGGHDTKNWSRIELYKVTLDQGY